MISETNITPNPINIPYHPEIIFENKIEEDETNSQVMMVNINVSFAFLSILISFLLVEYIISLPYIYIGVYLYNQIKNSQTRCITNAEVAIE